LSKQYPIEMFQEDVAPPRMAKPANFRRKSTLLSVAVCALVIPGLFVTVAVPAYGAGVPGSKSLSDSLQHSIRVPQTLDVSAAATSATVAPAGAFGVIAPKPVVHTSTRVRSFGAVNLSGIAGIAARYLGVPYVYGGSSPAGFDCSGFVKFVYAQVGVSLPHSAAEQGRLGTRIPVAAAVPGDVVVLDGGSHVGIYVGGGRMIDAPVPGRVVSVDAIYDSNYYIVRF
jgi:cell wall-associated NlpC family hydrolase